MDCGFLVNALTNSVGTLIVDWVANPLRRQFDYLRHFKDNVENFKEGKVDLLIERDRLQHEIEVAGNQLLDIGAGAQGSLEKAVDILNDAESIQQEIDKDKRCFCRCPNWWWRYRLSKKLEKKKLVAISEHLNKMAQFGQPGRVGYRSARTIPTVEFLLSKDFVASKASEKAFSQIFEALKDENVSMIGVWGMGGSGKTTLVREVGNQAEKSNLFDKVVITTVSQKPNFHAIQDEIAKFLDDFDMNCERERRSAQELWHRLGKEKKILIILDDVWAEINLKEKIGIPDGEDHKGCKVLLTTRRQHVCHSMKSRTVQLGCFDDEEAWALFEKKAGSLENSHDDIKKVAHKIVKKCNGLPISIATLGSALKGKTNPHTWESAYRRLEDHRLPDIEDINEENAYKCLEVSFDYLNDERTKMCFLLCSLFPEDHEIYVEDLAIYAWGLELYSGARSVEQVRSEVHAAVDIMKSSCLLIDSGERHVKMHDLVRDVALWIASGRGELSFSIKSEVLETWPDESFEPYAAISFKTSRKDELPQGLICPNLKILLLLHDGDGDYSVHDRLISPEAFRSQTNLRTLHLECCKFLNASILRKLTNLRTLHLERCILPNISILGDLNQLQVLSFIGSDIKVLPKGISNLNKLKLLDLSNCQSLQRIPSDLIPRLSKLEELYLGGCTSINWATEKTTLKSKRASLSELNSLPKLTVLSLVVAPRHLPNKFLFPKLDWYDVIILLDESGSTIPFYKRKDFQICPIKRALKVDASVIGACKQLFVDVESLHLINLEGSEDLVSSLGLEFDQRGLSRLTSLLLNSCKDIKCLFDATMEHVPTTTFSNLVELKLENMLGLKELCNGHQPEWFLSKLKTLRIYSCKEMIAAIPMLQNLETLEVKDCDKIEVLLQTVELGSIQQASSHPSLKGLKFVIIDNCSKLKYLFPATVADSLGQLETLKICNCEGLEEIIKGAEQQVLSHPSLKGLKFVEVDMCNKLRYLFPAVVANSLGQLETLKICNCEELEEIIKGTEVSSLSLQSLREVYIDCCDKLTSLSSLSHGHFLENLRKLHIRYCSGLKYTFPTSMAEGLPQLNEVYLENLPELKGTDGNEIVLLLPSLQILGVEFCRQLTPLIISAKIQEFQFGRFSKTNQVGDLKKMVPAELRGKSANMEYVTITTNFEDCLFDAATFNLSSINKLTLCELYDLRVVWKGPIQVLNFQNLTDLQVVQCPKLRYIFSSTTMVRNLPQLSFLRIFLCDGLEQIFEKDETSSQHYQPLCFPNLTCIDIHSCSNLKSLFPVSVARNLPKLMLLQMEHVSKLEEVFENGDDEANTSQDNEKVIHLPHLQTLELDNLDNLKSFSPMGYHFVLPRLRDLAVKRCPRITTRFSIDSDQWGHAIETITSIDKNIAKASPTTHQTTWPIRSEIRYRRKE